MAYVPKRGATATECNDLGPSICKFGKVSTTNNTTDRQSFRICILSLSSSCGEQQALGEYIKTWQIGEFFAVYIRTLTQRSLPAFSTLSSSRTCVLFRWLVIDSFYYPITLSFFLKKRKEPDEFP